METTLEGLSLTPSHEKWRQPQGDHTKQLLYQGAEMPEERKLEESLCTEEVERKVGSSIPTDNKVFWPFFNLKSHDNDDFCSCAYSILVWSINRKLWQNFSVIYCNHL